MSGKKRHRRAENPTFCSRKGQQHLASAISHCACASDCRVAPTSCSSMGHYCRFLRFGFYRRRKANWRQRSIQACGSDSGSGRSNVNVGRARPLRPKAEGFGMEWSHLGECSTYGCIFSCALERALRTISIQLWERWVTPPLPPRRTAGGISRSRF
jgi:hypothetical protein